MGVGGCHPCQLQFHPLVYFAQRVHIREMEHQKHSSHGRWRLCISEQPLKLKQLLVAQGAWQLLPVSPKVSREIHSKALEELKIS